MKKLPFLLLLLTITALRAFAQDNQAYVQAMEKNINRLDSAQTLSEVQELANNFDRIAALKTGEWLPLYYASLSRLREAFMQQDKSKIDAIVDQAQALADKADSLDPDKTEMLCLRSIIASARITVDPQSRGMEYGPVSAQLLDQAEQISPENPRITLLKGQAAFYTPAQWGGGKDVAKPLFEKALKQFAAFKAAGPLAPHWGKTLTKTLLSQCDS